MGTLRFLLALSVVIAHSTAIFGLSMVGGSIAVEAFFLISGFYMALILAQKYKSYQSFLTNRILRIYPLYWVMAGIMGMVVLLALFFKIPLGSFLSGPAHINSIVLIAIVASNILLLGQDVMYFTPYSKLLLLPQGWALSLEMIFYIIAPFLVRWNTWILSLIGAASLGLRIIFTFSGFSYDPWIYHFFPTQLFLFIAGIVSFRIYQKISEKPINDFFSQIVFCGVVAMTVFYQYLPGVEIKQWAYYIVLFLALPFTFHLLKNSHLDRRIGDFAYPVYLSHVFIFLITKRIIVPFFNFNEHYMGLITALLAIAFSYALLKFFGDPLERLRQKRIAVVTPTIKNMAA